jgi:hypothetical protein
MSGLFFGCIVLFTALCTVIRNAFSGHGDARICVVLALEEKKKSLGNAAFNTFDRNGGGVITRAEFADAVF